MKLKIAVSLPTPLVKRMRSEVRGGRAASVSAYVSAALAEKVRRDGMVRLLDELDRELGAPSKEDFAWADRVLGLSSSTAARSSR